MCVAVFQQNFIYKQVMVWPVGPSLLTHVAPYHIVSAPLGMPRIAYSDLKKAHK